jgi:hypothetical protein
VRGQQSRSVTFAVEIKIGGDGRELTGGPRLVGNARPLLSAALIAVCDGLTVSADLPANGEFLMSAYRPARGPMLIAASQGT